MLQYQTVASSNDININQSLSVELDVTEVYNKTPTKT